MPTFLTPNRHGYSVRFSPFSPDRLVVATSQYFGLAGGGTLFFLELSPDGATVVELQKLEWTDGLFDVVSCNELYTLTVPTFLTPNRHGYSVRFSPFSPDRLVVATNQYLGLAGGGTLFFLELSPDGATVVELQKLEWTDGLFDVVSCNELTTLTVPTFLTPNRHGYSVRFSPFSPDRLVVATSQYFGLAGGGTLFFLELSPDGATVVELQKLEWTDGLFDVVWSEAEAGVAVSAAGDGALQVWRAGCTAALRVLREHRKEVYSVDWSRTRRNHHVLSASWDCTVKLWDPNSEGSISTYAGHSQLVYNAMFSPHIPSTFASVSGDGHLKIWSCASPARPSTSVKAHDAEVLSCDWCKYEQNKLCTAGSDGLIRGWDIRNLTSAVFELKGCEYAVRRVQFSPHCSSVIAAVSYDFTTRIWDYKRGSEPLETIKHHSEFTYGLDWNLLRKNQLADCGWDSLVHVFSPRSLAT